MRQEDVPCKMCNVNPDDPQCCWAECVDCGGMFHMVRATEDDATDEIVDFDLG